MSQVNLRSQKVASQIKEELSTLIEHKLSDPGKGFITVTRVRLSADLKIANIYYSVLGDSTQRDESKKTLARANSFLKHKLGNKLRLRFLPELRFFYDDSLDYSERILNLLKKIHNDENNR